MFNPVFGGQPVVDPDELMQKDPAMQNAPSQEDAAHQNGLGFSATEPGVDEELWPGGPLTSQVLSWKKQFGEGNVYITEIVDELYIWRTLNRFEYKTIVLTPNTDALAREEMICEVCVLWHPYGPGPFNYEKMAAAKAGVPARLAELIMEKSGFDRVNTKTRAL